MEPERVYKTPIYRRKANAAYAKRHPERMKEMQRTYYERKKEEKRIQREKEHLEKIEINRLAFRNMGITTFPRV